MLLHGLALVAALAIPWACALRAKRQPPEPLKMVQIPISVRTASMPEPPAVEPSQPVSITEPVKEPVPKPEPKPAPKPKPVEKQTNRVTKTKVPLDPPRRPEPLTEEGIKQILTADMPVSGPVALEAGENDPVLAAYYKGYSRVPFKLPNSRILPISRTALGLCRPCDFFGLDLPKAKRGQNPCRNLSGKRPNVEKQGENESA